MLLMSQEKHQIQASMEKGGVPVESTRSRPTRESELEAYLNLVFDDLLLKDNGRTRQDIEAYYFLRVLSLL